MISAHRALVARLLHAGDLPWDWRTAFEEVERHRFLPECIVLDEQGTARVIDRQVNEDLWLEHAYADAPVITQVDDGSADGPGYPTSSASMPSIVALMLRRLRAFPGMRILEIGTGTGYNAALLAHRLGDDAVTSVEVDPNIAQQARDNLAKAGFAPFVATGDGMWGWGANAPYDRVISTAAVQQVPHTWAEQTVSGGRVVTPWGTAFHNGALVDLVVGPDGIAQGRFCGDAGFMWVRSQRVPRRLVETHVGEDDDHTVTRTRLYPKEPVGDFDASFAIGLRLPGVVNRVEFDGGPGSSNFTVYLVDPDSGSWASWHIDPDEYEHGYKVCQHGPREIFTELEEAHRWWVESGRPEHTRFGLTVRTDQQIVWLDEDTNAVTAVHRP